VDFFQLQSLIRQVHRPDVNYSELPKFETTWKEECNTELPRSEHAYVRERLLQLEEIHGDAIRERFPPGSLGSRPYSTVVRTSEVIR